MKQINPSLRKSFKKHALVGQRIGYNRTFSREIIGTHPRLTFNQYRKMRLGL